MIENTCHTCPPGYDPPCLPGSSIFSIFFMQLSSSQNPLWIVRGVTPHQCSQPRPFQGIWPYGSCPAGGLRFLGSWVLVSPARQPFSAGDWEAWGFAGPQALLPLSMSGTLPSNLRGKKDIVPGPCQVNTSFPAESWGGKLRCQLPVDGQQSSTFPSKLPFAFSLAG